MLLRGRLVLWVSLPLSSPINMFPIGVFEPAFLETRARSIGPIVYHIFASVAVPCPDHDAAGIRTLKPRAYKGPASGDVHGAVRLLKISRAPFSCRDGAEGRTGIEVRPLTGVLIAA